MRKVLEDKDKEFLNPAYNYTCGRSMPNIRLYNSLKSFDVELIQRRKKELESLRKKELDPRLHEELGNKIAAADKFIADVALAKLAAKG